MQYLIETRTHIEQVQSAMKEIISSLQLRAYDHDRDKQGSNSHIQREILDELNEIERNSDLSCQLLEKLELIKEKHLASNRHHPEFFEGKFSSMNLIDLIEMLADLKAKAVQERKSVEEVLSIECSEEVRTILVNTAKYLGWINGE